MAGRTLGFAVLIVFAVFCRACDAFYLPGIAQENFEEGFPLPVYADRLFAPGLAGQLPFEYFSLPFCRGPPETLRQQHLNLGEILLGQRNQLTDYKINMLANETCRVYCSQHFTSKEVQKFADKIMNGYFVSLNVDNMPAVMRQETPKGPKFSMGVPLGRQKQSSTRVEEVISLYKPVIFNHLQFRIRYHRASPQSVSDLSAVGDNDQYRVVGFEVKPRSDENIMTNGVLEGCETDEPGKEMELHPSDPVGQIITFSYDVEFVEDQELHWATRWDPLLVTDQAEVSFHRRYLLYSLLITFILSFLVAMVLARTVYLDYARYDNLDSADEIEAESGWKQVHGDVFRPPEYKEYLSICVGCGTQITVIVVITLAFSLLGFWSPAYRGGLLTSLILLWVLTSVLGGFVSALLHSEFGGKNRKVVTLGSAFFFSGSMFVTFFFVNLVLSFAGSSAAVRFLTLLQLLLLWLALSVPLNVFGAFLGYKQKLREYPCPTNPLPREIPEYSKIPPRAFCFLSGSIPFLIVFMELQFVMEALWQRNAYIMAGVLCGVFMLLMIACVEVSLVLSYLILSQEDYRWWWTSFWSSGSSGLYVFCYGLLFFLGNQNLGSMHLASVCLYFCYTVLISEGFTLMTGAVGFLASRVFVRRIFAAVRVD
mmetsp:Transcript_42360/g.165386  ORF Transcript_42360/g.165386 Transcript_42360/m.165386 type:complete len:652 (-) Transcript_42360:404-2359(-)